MKMHACQFSSQVAAYGYETTTQEMQIRFKTGSTYRYKRVPYEVFMGLVKAVSKGGYIHEHIKGKYDYEKI